MKYTVVIRTLGKAGSKYQSLLDSLCRQTLQPEKIIVYIADGFPIPRESCGKEEYIYVRKGMVAQRALRYDEVETEYILFVDDDVYFPTDGVERLYEALKLNNADVVSPDVFDNASRGLAAEIMMTLSGRMRARRCDRRWAYKVMSTCGYSYNKYPAAGAYLSQTNGGPCFLCRKNDFLNIKFEEELWLDSTGYPIGEDQAMYYKMYLTGLKQLTLFGSGIQHLDGGNNLGSKEKELKLIEGDYFFRKVFWHRFLQAHETNMLKRLRNIAGINYFYAFGQLISVLKADKDVLAAKRAGMKRATEFIKSSQYKAIPPVRVSIKK